MIIWSAGSADNANSRKNSTRIVGTKPGEKPPVRNAPERMRKTDTRKRKIETMDEAQVELPRFLTEVWALEIAEIKREPGLNMDGQNACMIYPNDKAYAPIMFRVKDLPKNAGAGWYFTILQGVSPILIPPSSFEAFYGRVPEKVHVTEPQVPDKFEVSMSEVDERPSALESVILDMIAEVNNQRQKWGEQNHDPSFYLNILMEEVGEASKEIVDATFAEGADNIQKHLTQYRTEMVQVAAVAISMIESYDRNL